MHILLEKEYIIIRSYINSILGSYKSNLQIEKQFLVSASLHVYRVSPKRLSFQFQISALIQTTYCSSLKFIIAFERRIYVRTCIVLIHMGDEKKLL